MNARRISFVLDTSLCAPFIGQRPAVRSQSMAGGKTDEGPVQTAGYRQCHHQTHPAGSTLCAVPGGQSGA